MVRMIFDILETNIAAAIGIALLCLFAGKLRKRYGAGDENGVGFAGSTAFDSL